MDAPDFEPGYPSKGERLAPAWRTAWHFLADGQWHTSFEIVEKMLNLPNPLVGKTCGALLRKAYGAGLLERRRGAEPNAKIYYRRAR